ncbi:MAG: DUF4912 domain-containing protein [Cyanobacteria bacterium P01_F01_bin.150]
MGTSKSLSLFTLFLALTATPQAALALRLSPLMAQSVVEPVFSLPESVDDGTTIKIGSSSTLAGVNEVLEQRFENQYSGAKVELDYTSSDEALAALEQGKVDIAAIGRPLTDAEKAQGYTEILLGRHKIAIIVSEENGFNGDVTTEQFAQIFRGEIADWSALEGGTPGAIRFVDRPDSSDTRQSFSAYPVFNAVPFEVGATANPVGQDSTESVLDALGTDGLGFAIADQVVNRPGFRILTMHQVLPTNPAYPFSQPLAYVYKGEASPAVQAFLGYATAPSTAGVLEEAKALGAEATFAGFQGTPNLDSAAVASLVGTPASEGSAGDATPGTSPSDSTDTPETPEAAGAAGSADDSDSAAADTAASTGGEDAAEGAAEGAAGTADNTEEGAAEGTTTAEGAAEGAGAAAGTTAEDTTANSAEDEGVVAATTEDGKFPWWLLWLLGIPVLGGLLWWLLGRRTDNDEEVSPVAGVDPSSIDAAAGTAAVAGAGLAAGAIATDDDDNQMVLVPRDSQSAYAYWEVSDESHAKLREDGGEEFGLRLYDVTSLPPEAELPTPLLQENFDDQECDRHINIPTPDRDYVSEVGYKTASDQWLAAARSTPIHVASDLPPFSSVVASSSTASPAAPSGFGKAVDGLKDGLGEVRDVAASAVDGVSTKAKAVADGASEGVSGTANGVKGAAIAGTAAVAAGVAAVASQMGQGSESEVSKADSKATDPNRLILVPRDGKDAYAYWEISQEKQAALKERGGQKMALRLYDVTGIDPRKQKPHGVQQFDCNEADNDLHVTVPAADRTYLADLGYIAEDGKWLRLAHAAPVQVPAPENTDSSSPKANGNGIGLSLGGRMDGIKAKADDAFQTGKDAVGAGQSITAKMGKLIVNKGTNAGQALVDGTVKTGKAVANTGQSMTTETANAIKIAATSTATAGAAVAAATAASAKKAVADGTSMGQRVFKPVNIVIVPRSEDSAYAYWEMADGVEASLRQKHVETLSLRIHEVTDIDMDYTPAHSTQAFECKVTDRDRHVPIPFADKDYLAEIGYTQKDGTWVKLARSLHVRVA